MSSPNILFLDVAAQKVMGLWEYKQASLCCWQLPHYLLPRVAFLAMTNCFPADSGDGTVLKWGSACPVPGLEIWLRSGNRSIPALSSHKGLRSFQCHPSC